MEVHECRQALWSGAPSRLLEREEVDTILSILMQSLDQTVVVEELFHRFNSPVVSRDPTKHKLSLETKGSAAGGQRMSTPPLNEKAERGE